MSILEKRVEYNFPCSLLSDETGRVTAISACVSHGFLRSWETLSQACIQ
uniref:Uncharacterized protein n=1 Tax=Setaria viridis TaxID=4556 RepID=A0A4U6TIG6_SETVI|nr:hypothetical protein SEVIR_8G145701v2 [Setaria viridis]